MPDSAILDLHRLEEAFEDDREGIAELLEMAMDTGATHERALADAVAAGDAPAAARAAHSIKGSAANVGGLVVAQVSAEIETRARAGSLDGVAPMLVQLAAAYAKLRDEVRAYRAGIS